MRRSVLISFLIFALCSCEQMQEQDGDFIREDPVSACVLPSVAAAGGEVVMQWNGFLEGDIIFLRSDSGEEYRMEPGVVTASGLIFSIPFTTMPGSYSVILKREADIVMGVIEITAPDIPVSGISVPDSAIGGESILISGVGFAGEMLVIFVSQEGDRTVMESSLVSKGVSVYIPQDMAGKEYDLILSYMGYEWVISDIRVASAKKSLSALTYIAPYSGEIEISYTWDISSEQITLTEHYIEGGTASEGVSDIYVAVGDGSFVLAEDGFEMSNDIEMSYHSGEGGSVAYSDVLLYGDDEPVRFDWNYDHQGYLQSITYMTTKGERAFKSLAYTGNNITGFGGVAFQYADPSLVNNAYAADVVWGYMAVMDKFEPFIYIPYMLDWYTARTTNLPTSVIVNNGMSETAAPLSYEFDEDGYVVQMSWNENRHSHKIIFTY